MPTYQYACTECGHAFEQFQSFSDDALTVCPRCEGRLRKVFNAVGVVFKGSGFYRNDSRTDGKPEKKEAARSEASSSSSSESGSSSDASSGSDATTKQTSASGSKGSADGSAGTPKKSGSSDSTSAA